MKSELVANIIWLIHVLVVILMVLVPLFGNKKYVSMYILIVPFLFFHWATNDDTCFLTILERKLRNVEKKDAFLQKLISPIYLLPNDFYIIIVYIPLVQLKKCYNKIKMNILWFI
jgi:hypothetical protein